MTRYARPTGFTKGEFLPRRWEPGLYRNSVPDLRGRNSPLGLGRQDRFLTMNIGILFTVNEYSVDPASLASCKMEALGFESLWIPEHAIIPVHTSTPLPESPPGQGQIPEVYSHICDPFVAMSLAAAVTTRLKLATGVMLVPERNPIVAAKEIATLDYFSGGRVMLGIGAGWLKEESEILGVDFAHRWSQTKEYIASMRELWTKPEPSFRGKYVNFPPVRMYPKPAQLWVVHRS